MIKDDARPHRALVVLGNATEPLREDEIWASAKIDANDTAPFHEALNALVQHRYATKTGERGGYRWSITDAGRARLRGEQ